MKESLGRILKAVEVLSMNLGSIYLDFCEPFTITDFIKEETVKNPRLDPLNNEKDRQAITNDLGLKIVYEIQDNVRIMPTSLVAAILLLNRKGISEHELEKKVKWLG